MKFIFKILHSPTKKMITGVVLLFVLYVMYLLSAVFWLGTIILYLAVWLIISALLDLLVKNKFVFGLLKSNFAIFTVLMFILDIGLRMYGEKKNYAEKNGSFFYQSLYKASDKGKELHTYTPNTNFKRTTKEFSYFRSINTLGLPEDEIPKNKQESEYRIFTLGDSYTEGVGASKDSSYPTFFESCLTNQFPNKTIRVFNAGVSGSDLIYMERLFARELSKLRPNGIVVMLNSSDVWEIATRGGKNRAAKNENSLQVIDAPLTEMIFASSFIYRHILMDVFDYDENLMSPKEVEE